MKTFTFIRYNNEKICQMKPETICQMKPETMA